MAEQVLLLVYVFGLGFNWAWLELPNREFGAWVDWALWPFCWPAGVARKAWRKRSG